MEVSIVMGVPPIAGWFLGKSHLEIRMIWGYRILGNLHMMIPIYLRITNLIVLLFLCFSPDDDLTQSFFSGSIFDLLIREN